MNTANVFKVKEKKLTVLLMMLLDNKEYKHMKGKTGYASGCQEEKKEVLIAQFHETHPQGFCQICRLHEKASL